MAYRTSYRVDTPLCKLIIHKFRLGTEVALLLDDLHSGTIRYRCELIQYTRGRSKESAKFEKKASNSNYEAASNNVVSQVDLFIFD